LPAAPRHYSAISYQAIHSHSTLQFQIKSRIEKIRKDKIKIGGMRGEMRVKLKMKVRIKRWWKLSKTAHLLRKYGVIELLEILLFGLIVILLARIFGC